MRDRYQGGPQDGVFTDGSCSGNPGPGGWGFVWVRDGEVIAEEHGHDPETTNNRMELVALIRALEALPASEHVALYSDSKLVIDTLTKWARGWERNGWRRKTGEVKNVDLVRRAWALVQERPHVELRWIKAHDGSLWNEYADALATAYMRQTV